MSEKRWTSLTGIPRRVTEEELIELVVSTEPAEGQVIDFRSLRGLEDSVACLLGHVGHAGTGDEGCSLAA